MKLKKFESSIGNLLIYHQAKGGGGDQVHRGYEVTLSLKE
jgi:hypothetical protein